MWANGFANAGDVSKTGTSRPCLAFSAAEMEDNVPDAMRKEVCITEQTQYYFENNQLSSFRGNIDCENCTR